VALVGGSALADHDVEPDAGGFVVDTGPWVVDPRETSSGEHMSLLGQGGGYRTAPETRGWLLKLTSSCWDCSEGPPVALIDVESGKSESALGWCSRLQHLGCFAPERSRKNGLGGWEPGALWDCGGHVPEWDHCSVGVLQTTGYGDVRSFVALDMLRFDDGRSQQMSVPGACDVHEACVEEPGYFEATVHDQSAEVWMETLRYQNQKYHRHRVPRNERLVGASDAGA
jgi:hypothetical protein